MPDKSLSNLNQIAGDLIRVLEIPKQTSAKPVCIILIGLPGSGKTFISKKLTERLPLVYLSEELVQAFLVPNKTFFDRGEEAVLELIYTTIDKLLHTKYSVIFDANLKKLENRMAIKSIVDKARSQIITLYLNCPENIAFDRLKQKNLEILRGDSREFVMETDYFYFEKNNLEKPIKSEQAYLFDTENSTLRDIDKLV
ncbi:MAG TPA: AAA family ATPase, partial [Patescibacteria group bacterium]